VSDDVVDVPFCQADVHQLSVTQLVQVDAQLLALAPVLKRAPISPERQLRAVSYISCSKRIV
jgi:hypothetical protein